MAYESILIGGPKDGRRAMVEQRLPVIAVPSLGFNPLPSLDMAKDEGPVNIEVFHYELRCHYKNALIYVFSGLSDREALMFLFKSFVDNCSTIQDGATKPPSFDKRLYDAGINESLGALSYSQIIKMIRAGGWKYRLWCTSLSKQRVDYTLSALSPGRTPIELTRRLLLPPVESLKNPGAFYASRFKQMSIQLYHKIKEYEDFRRRTVGG